MKFINSENQAFEINHTDVFEINLNKLGRPISDESEKIFAKTIGNTNSIPSQNKYAILVFNNQPYDPYGIDSHRESTLSLSLKQVSKQTHDMYVSYLKSKNSLYMTRAQRSFING
jgi:hypothetical protein